MATCAVVVGDRASRYPANVDRKTVAESIILEHDVSAEVDCAAAGITILQSDWVVNADDDDGSLVLGLASITGLVTAVPVSGGTVSGTNPTTYRIDNTVQTSDGRTLVFTSQVVVASTLKSAA